MIKRVWITLLKINLIQQNFQFFNAFSLFGSDITFVSRSIFIFSMGTNIIPLLNNLFLLSHQVDFIQMLLKKKGKEVSRSFSPSPYAI